MAGKYDLITELYQSTCKLIVSTPEEWQSFLRSACRNYRLRFDEQILVYAQRPDATAVLDAYSWSDNFGRWVNRGSKGIAVFENSNHNRQRLVHYFDITDTHTTKRSQPVIKWKMRDGYEENVINAIEHTFGALEDKATLEDAIMSGAKNASNAVAEKYFSDLLITKENSLLNRLSSESISVEYKKLISNSVAFMMMSRLDIDTSKFFEAGDFRAITNFNTTDTLNTLGCATKVATETGLTQISRTIVMLDRENNCLEYINENTNHTNERSSDYEQSRVHDGGRLLHSESSSSRTATSDVGQVRTASNEIPEGETRSDLHNIPDERHADEPLSRSGGKSEPVRGTAPPSNGTERGTDGGNEEHRPVEMGRYNEQPEKLSSGNGAKGSDLHLVRYDRAKEDSSIDFLHKDSDIKALLLSTPHLKASKSEISEYFKSHHDIYEQKEYLKDIFNTERTEIIIPDGRTMGYQVYANGVHLFEGNYNHITKQVFYGWEQLTRYFEGMRLLNELTDNMKPIPSVEEQLNIINKAEETKTPAFTFSQELIDAIHTRGTGFVDGKMRVYEQFKKNLPREENVAFLKKEYGIGGTYPAITGTNINVDYDGKGMHVSKGLKIGAPELHLSWVLVEKRLRELVKLNRYLNSKELERYPKWLEKETIKRAEIQEILQRKNGQTLSPTPEQAPETKHKYEYSLGDKVYFGADEYEISSIDSERVVLFNTKFPLFNEEMTFTEFDKKVRENPSNDHLRVVDENIQQAVELSAEIEADIPNIKELSIPAQYFNLKSEHPNEILLFQVGDFYEVMFGDAETVAKATDISLMSRKDGDMKLPMCGFPASQLELYSTLLLDRGHDLAIAAGDNHTVTILTSTKKNEPVNTYLVGRIDYYSNSGEITDSIEYTNPESLRNDLTFDSPFEKMGLVLYKNKQGEVIPHDFVNNLPNPLVSVEITDLENKEYESKFEEDITPVWEQEKEEKPTVKLSDTPYSERHNFDLKSHEIEVVGKKERFRRNIDAINVLKECEFENRFATPEEQITLSKYVGWGGIPEAFEEKNSSWSDEYKELITVLSPDEYSQASRSTLSAFYTPPTVINAIYKTLDNLGFKNGNLLEPSCGIGHFIGMIPDSMKDAKIYGVEIDPISAQIAQQLYQTTSIANQGFEETNLPDSFFDGVIGNVPFGDFKVLDKRYDKHNFLIHDYFFAKSLDKLRPGGVMALITSKGTMDKKNSSVRRYIAQRAELLGAIRLPNNTFKGNAGTEVVSDILFLQKRDRLVSTDPEWVYLKTNENGITANSYFIDHPEMVLGELKMVSGRYKEELSCIPFADADLETQLDKAIANIKGEITPYEVEISPDTADNTIPADPSVRNFSYTLCDNTLYFRENSWMKPVTLPKATEQRVRGLIEIRDSVRTLIELQTENYPDSAIKEEQATLNELYDNFTKKYGIINSRGNKNAFSQDSSFSLLSALEVLDGDGNFKCKADVFYKRTIKPHVPVTSVDTASEALALSIGEKAYVDMEYMAELTGKTENEMFNELKGVIFLNPLYEEGNHPESKYLMADEYLSGNVREKLAIAKNFAQNNPEEFSVNVEALTKVQPKDLSASEISVRLGATWITPDIVSQFTHELLETPVYARHNIKAQYSPHTSEWRISDKNFDSMNVKANSTYGTSRVNAYKIIEDTLNLKESRVFDYVDDGHGNTKAVLNKKETAIAQAKQELIKQEFQDWIWTDPQRREKLTKYYNEKFNSMRAREFDGSHITFSGMNPEIQLLEHQKNAVAHILYGGNTLLAHTVGAGKTFEMVAASQELKRLGLCNKSMFSVPNHLTEQLAAEYLQLYPSANILVATKKDFETKNRKRFCGRIATGDYDAVIIGHSQFEKIPMSIERQRATLEQQIDDIMGGIAELKEKKGEIFSIKQLEKTKKNLEVKLEKLNDQTRKDDIVTFEELGIDQLFVDESHYFKNLFLYTKMRNVSGIAQTEAQKSSDLFMKCRYLDEITGGRGVVFASGTPISNSMVELYTIQRYLQYSTLQKNDLEHFDAWASTFGETVTAVELTPEGSGYRAKTKFARFYNLPELMTMFKEVADIKTADMLNLPVPKANYHTIAVKPSETQKELVASFGERAEKIRTGSVDSSEDNMLKITNDGRKLALDQRLINDMLPDFEGSKLNACVDNIYRIWEETAKDRLAQLVFCDLSTPSKDGKFNVYDDIRNKLIEKGIPAEEIKFIHEAETDVKKKELFEKTRKGDVRVLLGSTQKMGAGTNVQDKLIALHDLDCPWRPSDLEQRSGRIVRQGNQNPEVDIYRYVTEETFDAYLYQIVEGKQKFASQIMTSKSPVRSAEDIDEAALSYAEIKMLATGNPFIKEKMDLDIQAQKLKLLKTNYLSEKYRLEDKIIKHYPQEITFLTAKLTGLESDIQTAKLNPKPDKDHFSGMTISDTYYTDKSQAGEAILRACKAKQKPEVTPLGNYRGFNLELGFNIFEHSYFVRIKGKTSIDVDLGNDAHGNLTRIDNGIEKFKDNFEKTLNELDNVKTQLETAKLEVKKPFAKEDELKAVLSRLDELNAMLNLDDKPVSDSVEAKATNNQTDSPQTPILPNQIQSNGNVQTM